MLVVLAPAGGRPLQNLFWVCGCPRPVFHLCGRPVRAGLSSEYVCCSDLKAEAMTGSSSSSSKEPLLEKAFSVAPCNLVRKVQILLDGRRAYAAPSGAWKRKQESILKPARDCYETLSLESIRR